MTQEKKSNGKTNGKTNGQNNKVKEEQIIPIQTYKEFFNYWDNTEYEELDAKSIKEILGKYLFVPLPKDVRNRKAIDEWFAKIKEMREKGKPFGGITVNFAGQKDSIESVFGNKPLKITEVTKQLHFFINDRHLSSKNSEPKAKTDPKVKEKNGKKTVKVNSVADMEKAVEKITKNGKK